MDPFSDSGELFNIQRSLYTGDYAQVINTDTSSFTLQNKLQAQVLVCRAKIALGKAQDVISELRDVQEPDLKIVRAFAEYVTGAKEPALTQLDELMSANGDNHQVEFLGSMILTLENRLEEATKLLLRHQGSLECISMLVQVYILQNDTAKAEREVEGAKKWAQDNIVFNLCESWVELRKGGESNCQSSFYIYEELTAGMQQTAKSLNGKAVSVYCQPQRTDNLDKQEKEQLSEQRDGALTEALELEPDNADVLANCIASAIVQGKDYNDLETKLDQVAKDHPSLTDVEQKTQLFDKIVEKYAAAA